MKKVDIDIAPVLAMMRSVYRIVRIAPFVYALIYIAGLIAYVCWDNEESNILKVLLYVSPVSVIYNLLLSKAFKLCIWHRLECCLPLAVVIPLAVDAFLPLDRISSYIIPGIIFLYIVISVMNLRCIFHGDTVKHILYGHKETPSHNT